jgi:hypothetical protein
MKQLYRLFSYYLLLLTITLLPKNILAQGFINYSTYLGGSGSDRPISTKVANGETYILGITTSSNFPVTNGSHYSGGNDGTITKLDTSGKIIYSAYIGGNGDDSLIAMEVVNGAVYIAGNTTSPNYPVTNGSVYGGNGDIVITKLDANGSITFSSYIGGGQNEKLATGNSPATAGVPLQVVNNNIYVTGNTSSANFPVTNGQANKGSSDGFVVKLDTSGNTIFSTCIGGASSEQITSMLIDNNDIYVSGTTASTDFPVTNGSNIIAGNSEAFVTHLNMNGSILFASYIGGSGSIILQMRIQNGNLYLSGATTAQNLPVTDGSISSSALSGFIICLKNNGNIIYYSYESQPGKVISLPYQMEVTNGEVYLAIEYVDSLTTIVVNSKIIKLNATGETIFSSEEFPISFTTMKIINGEAYLAGTTPSSYYPVTNGSTFTGVNAGVFTKLDASGSTAYSAYLGQMSVLNDMQVVADKVYIAGTTSLASYPSTNGSTVSGLNDDIVIVLNSDGSSYFASYLGGTNSESNIGLQIDSGAVYISGQTTSVGYPVTDSSRYKASGDTYVTKLLFCPFHYDVTNDTLSPAVQTTCKLGLGTNITGRSIIIDSNEIPVLYRNGLKLQQSTEATYQWQTANSASGPWSNIVSATSKNYLPTGGSITEYYRRLAYTLPDCSILPADTSSVATVFVNNNIAPVINAGGSFHICPGNTIAIGGSPTATGGNLPYIKYNWGPATDSIANPVVAPIVSTIYTLTVTDNLGCQQLDQALVNVYRPADAGPDKNNCAGVAVRIGTAPIVNVPGATYNWQPSTGLSDASIAQPSASPTDSTLYTLTISLPQSGGGTCTTVDSVNVVPVEAPAANFAGPDQVICLGASANLGSAGLPGYTYTWAPGNYLQSNDASTTTFYPGNKIMPVPNPNIINVTAQREGCSFTDQVIVAVIESNIGPSDLCGPLVIGTQDRTPDINETYIWGKSGSGNFIGATNLPQVPVSASTTSSTTYSLIVEYNGSFCISSMVVPVCGGGGSGDYGCLLDTIYVSAEYGCASYAVNGGNVSLTAGSILPGYVCTWSPTEGLSDSIGTTVNLTDNVPRTYTVTATNISNPSDHCSFQVKVNDPAFSKPTFTAKDTVGCIGVPVNIGQATVAGYLYAWEGDDLSSNAISNPAATINTVSPIDTSLEFPVIIIDTATGCFMRDTAKLAIQIVTANAGGNQIVCNNAIITLGTPAKPNTTYAWYPPASPWQNGTDSSFAKPDVLVATSNVFVVTATSPAGCSKSDFAIIAVNNSSTIPDAPDTVYCKGTPGITIGSPALPGVIYAWTPTAGLSNPAIAQPIASPITNTIYTVTATFPGSCLNTATDQVLVRVSDPSFTLPDINYCPTVSFVALGAAAPAGMTSYSWSPAGLLSNDSIANPTTLTPPPATATTYTLTVTNSDRCTAKNTTTIQPMTDPPFAGTDRGICLNSNTTLGSADNITAANIVYSWNPAAGLDNSSSPTPLFTPTSTGTFVYTVTKTDNSIGCSNFDSVTVTVNDFNLPAIVSPSICQNSCVQIGTTPAAGVTYSWSPAAGLSNAAIANPLACAGTTTNTYTLTGTNANGCSDNATVLVIVNPIPAPLINIPSVTACLGTNNVTFYPVITPAATYDYEWTPNDGTLNNIYSDTPSVLLTSTGNKQYSLTVTDTVTGCSSTTSTTLTTNICSVLSSIGDYVWFDLNTDGIQDTNEPGVSGVTVTLYNSLNFAIASSITDATGHYLINNISPDTGYYITFTRPTGYTFTQQNIGGSNAVNNSKPNTIGQTLTFNLTANENLTAIDAGVIPVENVLSITLVNFTGALQNSEVVLNWQTAAEYNNSYFNVEKSTDGIHFVVIGTVKGNGTSNIPHNYIYIDTQPGNGTSYYRLEQIDNDGNGTYSDIIAITNNTQQKVNAYYNNQLNAIMIIFKTLQKGNVQFNLFADDGQLVKSLSAENILTQQLNTQDLCKGIYLLQISSNTLNYSQKIFIQ